jgi:hypothetical protein
MQTVFCDDSAKLVALIGLGVFAAWLQVQLTPTSCMAIDPVTPALARKNEAKRLCEVDQFGKGQAAAGVETDEKLCGAGHYRPPNEGTKKPAATNRYGFWSQLCDAD